jgi:F-box/TPR repeat protein Pof3
MVVKRKATSDVFPGQDVSSINTASTKRLSLGWGAWGKYHQHGQDLARKGKYEEAIGVLSEVGFFISS